MRFGTGGRKERVRGVMRPPFCSACGRRSRDPACCQVVAQDYDREGEWIGEEPAFCERCGNSIAWGRRGLDHGCPPLPIRFYGVASEFGAFSNFAPYPIRIEGQLFPTSEHYFQALKFRGSEHAETIRRAATPGKAARFGRSRRFRIRPDWEAVKRDVMLRALRAKFGQHAELRALLLSTGRAPLVEHTPRDSYWGDGGDGSGKNWLGRLLVRVRAELRGEGEASGGDE